jgi:hypothetical protein
MTVTIWKRLFGACAVSASACFLLAIFVGARGPAFVGAVALLGAIGAFMGGNRAFARELAARSPAELDDTDEVEP